MAQKRKVTVWHKKRGKFIPASSVKPHALKEDVQQKQDRKRSFIKNLSAKIKKAVRKASD